MTSASPRPRVLLVDGDLQARLVFEVTLKASGYDVLLAAQGEEALSLLTRETVDVVVADTELAELDGFQLCSSLRARPEAARLLIVLLSSDRTQRNRARLAGSGADDFLLKPAYAHELDQRLRALLRRRQRERLIAGQDDGQPLGGALSEVAVVDLLSLIELSGRSGVLTVRGPSGSRGELYFRQGRVVDAEVGNLSGPEGVYRLLGWSTGTFLLEWKNIRRRDAVAMSNADILGEGLRRLDEWNRLLLGLPGTGAIYEVDYRKLADHLAEIPDEVNALLRLFDGVRSLVQVIEDSGFPDLDALRVIRRLVESRILVEAAPSEGAPATSNPVFDGWQPEVSAPLGEVPIVPPAEELLHEEVKSAGLPAPEKLPLATATSPGLGPRDPAAEAAKGSGRSTALGIPTLERPGALAEGAPLGSPSEEDAPLSPEGEPEPGSTHESPVPGLSLDMPEEPEASLPVAAEAPSAAAPPSESEPEDAIPRRQQTQIFSRKEAMEELGLSGRKSRWATAFLAAALVVAAGVSYGVWQSRGRESVPGVVPKETALGADEPRAPQESAENAEKSASSEGASKEPHPAVAPSLPRVELPGGARPAPPVIEEIGPKGPAQNGSTNPDEERPAQAASRGALPGAGDPRGATKAGEEAVAEVRRDAPPGKPTGVPGPRRGETSVGSPGSTESPEETAGGSPPSAAAAAADFKGDPVKVLSDCKTAFATGRFRQALAACSDATKGNPTSAVAFAMLAHAQLNRDKPNEALAAAEKAIALDPNQADAYVIVGGVEQDRGHTGAAKAAYLKYLQLAPRGRYASDLRAIVDTL